MKQAKKHEKERPRREKLWGPFLRLYTRFPIPWLFFIGAILLGVAATELALRVADLTIRVNKGELYNGVIIAYVLLSILNAVIIGFQNILVTYGTQTTTLRVRGVVWRAILGLSMKDVEQEGPSNLISCVTNDATQAASALQMLFLCASSLYALIRACMKMVIYNVRMSLVLVIAIPLAMLVFFIVGRMQFIASRRQYEALNTMTAFFSEHIACTKHVKAQGMEEREIEEGMHAIETRYKADILNVLFNMVQTGLFSLCGKLNTVLIAVGGSHLIRTGQMESTGINDFTTYSGTVEQYESEMLTLYQTVKGTQGSLRHVNEILGREAEQLDVGSPLGPSGDIELRDVQFSFDGEYSVLRGVSFTIPYGKRTVIIGGNGSGKSTVLKLLQGFYRPDSGSITINGQNLADVRLSDLRSRFAYVLQNTPLLAGTIRENLVYGAKTMPDEQTIIAAAKAANAHDFIRQLPDGYDTQVGSAGMHLSGGQRQRIAIARALLVQPEYLLLDEATASLDHQTGGQVFQNILDGKVPTVIYISHNMDEVRRADHAVVLRNGQVEASGTPEELARVSPTYRDYAAKQRVEVSV
ncbi:ABC transporter ATP-binding protein [Agathobaculum sp. Marseille-P7918]|uniref:ABC transporter ATP-binding protein n=1 Tax=Agathobaculum sp. Marseille-P7918 TaxID=2479843 RepID=UPI00356215B6